MSTDFDRTTRRNLAFTMVEVLVVIGTLAVLAVWLLSTLARLKVNAHRDTCVSRLKNVGLGFRVFSADHTNSYPFQISTNFGGSQEYANDASQL